PPLKGQKRTLAAHGIDAFGDLGRVGGLRQPFERVHAEQALSLDVAAHMHGPGEGADVRGNGTAYGRFAPLPTPRRSRSGAAAKAPRNLARARSRRALLRARHRPGQAPRDSRATIRPWPGPP